MACIFEDMANLRDMADPALAIRAMAAKVMTGFLLAVALACPANAVPRQVVAVTLRDTSSDPSITGMALTAAPSNVKAGQVTLEAVNKSKDQVHEVLVAPAPDANEMPYDKDRDTVIEGRVHPLGEISDLKPGTRGKITLHLKPGTYVLLCNEPGHYRAGMSTRLVVEK